MTPPPRARHGVGRVWQAPRAGRAVLTSARRDRDARPAPTAAARATTLRTISGLVRSDTGRIRFEGREITRAPPDAIVAAGIGHVPEGREIFPEFTVHENLLVGGHTVARSAASPRQLESVFRALPHPPRSAAPDRRHPLGRRAADARHRARPHDPAAPPPPGRARRSAWPPLLAREIFRVIRRIERRGRDRCCSSSRTRTARSPSPSRVTSSRPDASWSAAARPAVADPASGPPTSVSPNRRLPCAASPRRTRKHRWRPSHRTGSRSRRRAGTSTSAA